MDRTPQCRVCRFELTEIQGRDNGAETQCPRCGAWCDGDSSEGGGSVIRSVFLGAVAVALLGVFALRWTLRPVPDLSDRNATVSVADIRPGIAFAPLADPSTQAATDPATDPNAGNSAEAAKPSAPASSIYRWEGADEFAYEFSVKATLNGETTTTSGRLTYHVTSRNKQAIPPRQVKATGTAFAVTPQGHLLTCAHVVERAQAVTVVLQGKDHPAEVLAVDAARDLALLKIAAVDLPCVPLGQSAGAQLGEDVRALGYPLSDVLGTEIKVSRGSVAGIVLRDGERIFQVDAALNPGNSGGPILNDRGQAIAVACAKLSGEDVAKVGFCVPIDAARQFLADAEVEVAAAAEALPADGPAIVAATSPAVAFVKVDAAIGGGVQTALRTLWTSHSLANRGLRFELPITGIGNLVVDERGRLLGAANDRQLPYLLGSPAVLPLVPFPSSAKPNWSQREAASFVQGGDESRNGLGRMLPRFRFEDPGFDANVRITPAVDIAEFAVVSETETELVISRKHDFHTTDAPHGFSASLTDEGTFTIDKTRGIPDRIELKGTFVQESEQLKVKLPIELTLRRLETPARTAPARAMATPSPQLLPRTAPSQETSEVLPLSERLRIPGRGWTVQSLAFSPDSKWLVTARIDMTLQVYDMADGRTVTDTERLDRLGIVSKLAFAPDGKTLAVGSRTGPVALFRLSETGALEPIGELAGDAAEISSLAVSSEGRRLFAGDAQGTLRCWDLETRMQLFEAAEFAGAVQALHVPDDGKIVLAADGRQVLEVDSADGTVKRRSAIGPVGYAQRNRFSKDGATIYVTDGYVLRRWETATGRQLPELVGKEMIWDFATTDDGVHVYCGGRGHLLRWHLAEAKLEGIVPLEKLIFYVKPMAISPDGRMLACSPSAAGQELFIFTLPADAGSDQ